MPPSSFFDRSSTTKGERKHALPHALLDRGIALQCVTQESRPFGDQLKLDIIQQ